MEQQAESLARRASNAGNEEAQGAKSVRLLTLFSSNEFLFVN